MNLGKLLLVLRAVFIPLCTVINAFFPIYDIQYVIYFTFETLMCSLYL